MPLVEDSYKGTGRSDGSLSFEGLVDLYYGPLYRFALNLSHAECDACDLVQETFLTWATKGGQLRDPAKAKSWLFTTLHRHFLAKHRAMVRFPQVELSEAELELPPVEPDWIDRLDGQSLMKLLARIDPQFQAAVALFYLEDYAYSEIAGILEIPLGTVKSRIARGLAQLRSLLRQSAPGGDGEELQ
jgi:RNA polymerase sigma-70 factor, ECF subfamily